MTPIKKVPEKRGRGRPRFNPTEDQRKLVKALVGYKIPHDEICLLITNRKDGKAISVNTLKKHFEEELITGFADAKMRIMAASFRSAIGDKDHPGNVTAQIWLSKAMFGMHETIAVDVPANPEPPASGETNLLEAARRVAFTLALGANVAKKQSKAKKQPA